MKKLAILIGLMLVFTGCAKYEKYTNSFKYLNNDIEISVYSKSDPSKNFQDIDNIYKKYSNINKEIDKVNNKKTKKISSDLEQVIRYGIDFNKASDGYININTKSLIDEYKNSIDLEIDFNKYNPSNIEIKDHKISNNEEIDISYYINGYANNEVYQYLLDSGIKRFYIKSGNITIVGDPLKAKEYEINIDNPTNDKTLLTLTLQNKAVVTRSIKDSSIKIDKEKYSTIINGKTLKPSNTNYSVTIITDNIKDAEMIANTVFLMDYEEGLNYIKGKNIEAIWCIKKDNKYTFKYTDALK